MFAHLTPESSDFGDSCALYSPFSHQLTKSSSLFEPGCLRPCPSYSRRRDRVNLGLLRSLYRGGAGVLEEGEGGGGTKVCVPKMGQSDFPYGKFCFFPQWSLWSGRGGKGGPGRGTPPPPMVYGNCTTSGGGGGGCTVDSWCTSRSLGPFPSWSFSPRESEWASPGARVSEGPRLVWAERRNVQGRAGHGRIPQAQALATEQTGVWTGHNSRALFERHPSLVACAGCGGRALHANHTEGAHMKRQKGYPEMLQPSLRRGGPESI